MWLALNGKHWCCWRYKPLATLHKANNLEEMVHGWRVVLNLTVL